MLKEIYCEKLKTKNNPSGQLLFHEGLNVILGTKSGTTSIGKSTALLLIDFAFGGDTYAKKKDAVTELGHHTIQFVFDFSGKSYRFARSTVNYDKIAILKEDGSAEVVISKKEFATFLAEKYGMAFPGLQFRNTISRFFRIYGKNNYNEFKPLETRGGEEGQQTAINVLICLFNRYEEIITFQTQLEEAKKKIEAFRTARKYEFIPSSVDGMKKYKQNILEIEMLKQERAELQYSDNRAINQEEVDKANRSNELAMLLRDARARVRQKQNDLHLVELNMEQGVYPTDADLDSLLEFFPEANIKKLLAVEQFHNKIQSILQEEFIETRNRIIDELQPLQAEVNQLIASIEEIRPSMGFSQEFLEAYTRIDRRIHKLEDENEAYDTKDRLDKERKNANDRLKNQIRMILSDLQTIIQQGMNEISDYVTEGINNPPELKIIEFNRYDFETPYDTGTGTNYKGMLIYDLAILENTLLPAMAHDSFLFPIMEDSHIAKLLELYSKVKGKQIFIAFDHQDRYGEKIEKLLNNNAVIQLGADELALFGRQWGRKDAHHENSI